MRDINFFNTYTTKGGQTEYFYKSLIILLVVGIIGSFSANTVRKVLLEKDIEFYQSKLETEYVKEQLELVEENNRELEAVNRYKSGLDTVLDSMETRDVVDNTILDQISSTLPSTVNFKTMNINHEVVTIQAVTTDRTSIGELQYNLKSLPIMDDVHVESISGSESLEGEYTFNLKCYLNGGVN